MYSRPGVSSGSGSRAAAGRAAGGEDGEEWFPQVHAFLAPAAGVRAGKPLTHFVALRVSQNEALKQHAKALQEAILASATDPAEMMLAAIDVRELHMTAIGFHIPSLEAYHVVVDSLELALKDQVATTNFLRDRKPQVTVEGVGAFGEHVLFLRLKEDDNLRTIRLWRRQLLKSLARSPGMNRYLLDWDSAREWYPHITIFKQKRWVDVNAPTEKRPPRFPAALWKPFQNADGGGIIAPILGCELASSVAPRDADDGFYQCEYYYSFPSADEKRARTGYEARGGGGGSSGGKGSSSSGTREEENILQDMLPNHSIDQIREALRMHGNSVEQAVLWLSSQEYEDTRAATTTTAAPYVAAIDLTDEGKKKKKTTR